MASQVRIKFELNCSPDAVRDAMRSPALIEASEKSRGALDVKVEDLFLDENRHEYVISVTNYARGIKGENRSKQERSKTTVKWDLKSNTRRWTWSGEHPIELTGEDIVTGSSVGATLNMSAQINVKIPVVGRVVAKKLKHGFEENWPKYSKLVEEFASKAT